MQVDFENCLFPMTNGNDVRYLCKESERIILRLGCLCSYSLTTVIVQRETKYSISNNDFKREYVFNVKANFLF